MSPFGWVLQLSIVITMILPFIAYKTRDVHVYVSVKMGKDTPTCGHIFKPCRSLDHTFAINKCDKSLKLTLYIDGGEHGNTSQLVYDMRKTVNITCASCRIRNYPSSGGMPRITMRSTGKTAFNTRGTLALQALEFDRLTIANVLTKATLLFTNCSFVNSRLVVNFGSNYISISIRSSRIFSLHQTPLFIHVNNATTFNFAMKDTHINGSGIIISKTSFVIRFENTTFRKFHWTLYGTRDHMNNLKVYDCRFMDRSTLKLKSQGRAYLKRNRFAASVTTVQTWKYLNFYRCNFTRQDQMFLLLRDLSFAAFDKSHFVNNTGRGLIMVTRVRKLNVKESLFVNNQFNQDAKPLDRFTCIGGALCLKIVNFTDISKSTFVNNSGLQGGAIYLWKSQVSINASVFVNNTAYEFGGTLYSEGNKRVSISHTIIKGPHKSRYKPLIGYLLYSKTAMRLQNISFIVNSNLVDNTVIVYIDTVQDVRSKKHTILSSFYLQCPVGYNVLGTFEKQSKQYKYISTKCVPCGKGRYNLKYGYSYKNKSEDGVVQKNISCLVCPSGGICDNRIESAGNHWGHVGKSGQVEFISCPIKYCCTRYGTPCESYNTCEKNREGKLCGKCKQGFSLDMWSLKCIPNGKYNHLYTAMYWVGHFVVAALYVVIILLFPKEIVRWIKWIMGIEEIKNIFRNVYAKMTKRMFPDEGVCDDNRENNAGSSGTNTNPIRDVFASENTEEVEETHLLPQQDSNNGHIEIVNGAGTTTGNSTNKRFSGLKKITFLFYQIEAILRVTSPLKTKSYHVTSHYINSLISFVFNIKVSSETKWFNFSPIKGLTIIEKELLRISFIFTLFLFLFMLWSLAKICLCVKKSRNTRENMNEHENVDGEIREPRAEELPFHIRVRCGVLKLSLFGYLSISTFLFKCLHCVTIGDSKQLYIDGNVTCFASWTSWFFILLLVIVIPYFITLRGSSKLLHSRKISPNEFFVALIFPLALIYWWLKRENAREFTADDVLAKERYFMVLYEPYRKENNAEHNVMWEWRVLVFRLSAAFIFTFNINPVIRLYWLILLLMLYLAHHVFYQPYSDKALNKIETISLVLLTCLACINLFWAHNYMGESSNAPQFKSIGKVFVWIELVVHVLPIAMVLMVFVLCVLIRLVILLFRCCRCMRVRLHQRDDERRFLINEE